MTLRLYGQAPNPHPQSLTNQKKNNTDTEPNNPSLILTTLKPSLTCENTRRNDPNSQNRECLQCLKQQTPVRMSRSLGSFGRALGKGLRAVWFGASLGFCHRPYSRLQPLQPRSLATAGSESGPPTWATSACLWGVV